MSAASYRPEWVGQIVLIGRLDYAVLGPAVEAGFVRLRRQIDGSVMFAADMHVAHAMAVAANEDRRRASGC